MSADTMSGWTAIPHGLWTLPCSPGARLMLGWLWSHQDAYRQRLSVRGIARQFGHARSSVTGWLTELEVGGMLAVVQADAGRPAAVVLDPDAWQALHHRIVARIPVENPGG